MTRALALKRQGQSARAIALLQDETDDNPDNARAHYLLGWLYRQRRNLAQATPGSQASATPPGNIMGQMAATPQFYRPKRDINKILAVMEFRLALSHGLKGSEANGARAALRRMGYAPTFPRASNSYNYSNYQSHLTPDQRINSELMMRELMARFNKPPLAVWLPQAAIKTAVCAVVWLLLALLMTGVTGQRFGRSDISLIVAACLLFAAIQTLDYATVAVRWTIVWGAGFVISTAIFYLTSLVTGARWLLTKRRLDKTGVISWSLALTMPVVFLLGSAVHALAVPSWAALACCAALWLLANPWFVVSQWAERLKKQGRYEQTVRLLEKWAHKPRLSDKTRFVVLNDLSSNYSLLGQTDKCLTTAEQALQYVHAFPAAGVFPRANLAEGYLAQGAFLPAVEHCAAIFQQARQGTCFGGNQVWLGAAHSMLANISLQRGWLDEAELQANLALKQLPPEVRNNTMAINRTALCKTIKAAVRLQQGDVEGALKLARQAVRPKPRFGSGAYAHSILGAALLAQEQVSEAEAECRTALKLMPQSPPAHYWLGRVLQAQGRAAEACQEWQTVIDLVPHSAFAALAQTALQPPSETTTSGGAMPAYDTAPEMATPVTAGAAPLDLDSAIPPPTLET